MPAAVPTLEELAARLRTAWPVMTWRPTGDAPRTIVVMHSISVFVTEHWRPLMPAFEERYLCFLLGLASPGTRVVYVTSMPIHPRLVDYWLGLVPGLDTPEVRSRLTLVPVIDARPLPLTRKVLDHPGTIRRIKEVIADPTMAVVTGHTVTDDDLRLSGLLGIPVYGAHPCFGHWGTKTGSREAFEASGVPIVPGVHGIRTRGDVSAAVEHLRAADPGLARVIVKIDDGVSGVGNGTIDLRTVVTSSTPSTRSCSRTGTSRPQPSTTALRRLVAWWRPSSSPRRCAARVPSSGCRPMATWRSSPRTNRCSADRTA
jgi:hypothetical protein